MLVNRSSSHSLLNRPRSRSRPRHRSLRAASGQRSVIRDVDLPPGLPSQTALILMPFAHGINHTNTRSEEAHAGFKSSSNQQGASARHHPGCHGLALLLQPSHLMRLWSFLFFCLLCSTDLVPAKPPSAGPRQMVRTELYFGSIPRGEWNKFLSEVVTPLFPEGLTWLDVQGQWRAPDGLTRKLPSRLLIILYTDTFRNDSAIEKLRTLFKDRYHHLAVLRVSSKVEASDDDWQPSAKFKRGAQYLQ
jgi:Protein of unknown function (DUF3574)